MALEKKYICFDLPTNLTAASVLNIYEYIMKPDANIYFPTRAHKIKLCTQINLENLKHQHLAPVFYALSRATFLFVCLFVCKFVRLFVCCCCCSIQRFIFYFISIICLPQKKIIQFQFKFLLVQLLFIFFYY